MDQFDSIVELSQLFAASAKLPYGADENAVNESNEANSITSEVKDFERNTLRRT